MKALHNSLYKNSQSQNIFNHSYLIDNEGLKEFIKKEIEVE